MDRTGADFENTIASVRKKLQVSTVPIQAITIRILIFMSSNL
jgi:translation elongation factor EF-G